MRIKVILIMAKILVLSGLSGCSKAQEKRPEVVPEGTTYIKVEAPELDEGLRFSISYWPPLEYYRQIEKEDSLAKAGEMIIPLDLGNPGEYSISLNDSMINLFLAPGDTVVIRYATLEDGKISIGFEGAFASINRFLQQDQAPEMNTPELWQLQRISASEEDGIRAKERYIFLLDSIKKAGIRHYQESAKDFAIPSWYLEYKKATYNLNACYSLISYRYRDKMDFAISREDLNLIDQHELNQYENLYSPFFYVFMPFYLEYKYQDSIRVDDAVVRTKNLMQNYISLAASGRQELNSSLWESWATAYFLSLAQTEYNTNETMKAYSWLEENITNSEYRSYLETHYQELMADDLARNPAPYFYLEDMEGQFHDLKAYQGKVVLLNFWFPGCKPCMLEVPHERNLYKELHSGGFEIINICMDGSREAWKRAITRQNMYGIQLYAAGNWKDKLKKGYKLNGFPHYTLINQQGLVEMNDTYRASDKRLKDMIISLLD